MTVNDMQLEQTVEIDAAPERVWALVTDVARMASWSPQVVRSFVRGRVVGPGTTFVNVNRRGPLFWPTRAKVVRFDPHRDFAFRIAENWTIWSFALEPTSAGGTVLTQRRETPRGISGLSVRLTNLVMGSEETFSEELLVGMRQTLQRIKAEAETADARA